MTARPAAGRRGGRRAPRRERGIALVIVLCLLLLMTVLAAAHSRNAQVEIRLADRQVEATAARYAAESAVSLAVFELLGADADDLPPADGRPRELRLDDRELVLSVRRASGLVDLNTAAEPLLRAVFVAAGTGEDAAGRLAAAIVDWRDADDLVHTDGAEDDDYAAAGYPWSAADRPFSSVEELRYVLGMTDALFRVTAPYFTVHSGEPGLDLDLAPEFLIHAVAGAGMPLGQGVTVGRARTGAFHINVAVHGANDVLVSCEAVVRLTGSTESPYTVLEWRDSSRILQQRSEPEQT